MAIRPLNVQEAQQLGIRGLALSGDVDAPAVEVTAKFIMQSYFDSVLQEQAILRQPPNEPIVPSTKRHEDLAGYALGLHPSSQTPVAVQFKGGQQQGSSAVYRLKPGEVIRPFGAPGVPGRFSGFDWGLPFGWLGGGNATLVVFRTADSTVDWIDRSEVIFHRQRVEILSPAAVPAAIPQNWPTRFPWPNAVSGANSLPQKGQPVLSVTPTRTILRLNVALLPAAATMRVYFVGSDEFDEQPDGSIVASDATGYDVVWGAWTNVVSANYAAQYQTQTFYEELSRISCNNGGVYFVAVDTSLVGYYVDVVRYGVL